MEKLSRILWTFINVGIFTQKSRVKKLLQYNKNNNIITTTTTTITIIIITTTTTTTTTATTTTTTSMHTFLHYPVMAAKHIQLEREKGEE